jgi:hypothetical protein
MRGTLQTRERLAYIKPSNALALSAVVVYVSPQSSSRSAGEAARPAA